MVKPHSPIAECRRKSSQVTQIPKKGATTLCSISKDARLSKTTSSSRQRKLDAWSGTRRVTFSKKVNVKETLHVNDMSENIRHRYWITEAEQTEIKNEIRNTILAMNRKDQGNTTKDDQFCFRGLECRTRQGHCEKVQRKESVRRAVLLQEQLQRDEGIYDDEFIAAISSSKSRSSIDNALKLALQDAEDAWQYLHERR